VPYRMGPMPMTWSDQLTY